MESKMKKIIAYLLVFLLAVQAVPVSADTDVSNVIEASGEIRDKLEIFSAGTCLLAGQTVTLTVTEGYSVKWASTNEKVATVDENGVVTAVSAGEAVITATDGKQSTKETIIVINPEERYTITYEITYPSDAKVQLYPDVQPTKPKGRTFTVKSSPVNSGEASAVRLDDGDYDTDNYVMSGWKTDDGTVHAKGGTMEISGDIKLTAVFTKVLEGGAQKGKSRFLATDGDIVYFTTGMPDNNAPDEYRNEKWKFLSIYCYPSTDENGQAMYTFRLPEATREVRFEGEGYNINTEDGAAAKTFVGYRLLKIRGVDDISAYTGKVYGIGELVTLPKSVTTDGYYFAPVFEEGQTGEAQVRIDYNGKITYIAQGRLSQDGMDALAAAEWKGSQWSDREAAIGGDPESAVDGSYLDSAKMPAVKTILNAYGLSAEDPGDWTVTWYKIARSNIGYYIVGALNRKQTSVADRENMVILVNGKKVSKVYNGEVQTFGEYTATSNSENFDADKVQVVREGGIEVSRKDCGIATLALNASDFAYDDPDVNATFVVSNGRLKITPALVTVRMGTLEKLWGQDDPDFMKNLIIEGLYGDDEINVNVTREPGEKADFYKLTVYGEQDKNSNYKVQFTDGVLVINMMPVTISSSLEGVESAPAGTEVTLTAVMEGLDTEHYHIQWQTGDTLDPAQMHNIEGANDITYKYIFNKDTVGKYFRVVVTLR